jgi:hypothetical protein
MGEATLGNGAVALLDILGAKALIGTITPAQFLSGMREIRERVELNKSALEAFSEVPIKLGTAFFSDTLLICVTGTASPEEIINVISTHVGAAIHAALHLPRPFTYRGCICFGQVAMEDAFVIGPAINEAAELYELAEAGIVWLAPSAKPHGVERRNLFEALVPLKGGRTLSTLVVNPLINTWHGSSPPYRADTNVPIDEKLKRTDPMYQAILDTFNSPNLDVAIKKQNTTELLRAALQACVVSDAESQPPAQQRKGDA